MLSSVFKKIFGQNKQSADVDANNVDLSRAIPGYVSPFQGEPEETSVASDTVSLELDQEAAESKDVEDFVLLDEQVDLENLAPEDKAEAAVEALAHKHTAWANNDLNNLQSAWTDIKGLESLEGKLQNLSRAAHNLKGMASTYGYPAISRIASSLTTLLESEQAHGQHALINLHVEACRAAHLQSDDPSANEKIAQSVCVALETQVKRTVSS